MVINEKRKHYNALKEHEGKKYTGMRVGSSHSWKYDGGIWNETKLSPDKWKFQFNCIKERSHEAPSGTGALKDTKYHWYIIADQKVVKLDENRYQTKMSGSKFKIGHQMPNWNNKWSYNYKGISYEEIIIKILENIIEKLRAKQKKREITNFFKNCN
jgi:hypothetical protein